MEERLLKFLLKRTGGDYEAACEAVQEAWVSALKSYSTFNHKSSYFTWISKIALHKLADYYRKQVRRRSYFVVPTIDKFNSLISPEISLEETVALDDLRQRVNKCLEMLPAEYKKLLQLRFYEQLSLKKISIQLNIPVRSIEGKMYRAKKLLAKLYAQF